MRLAILTVLFLASACAPRHSADPAPAPTGRAVTVALGDDALTFRVSDAWVPLPQAPGEGDFTVLQHVRRGDTVIAVAVEPADPGSTVQDRTGRWAVRLLSNRTLYVPDVILAKPTFASEEESSFSYGGAASTGVRMVSFCRIRLVGAGISDYWVAAFSSSPADMQAEAFQGIEEIVKNLRLKRITPPQ